MSLPEQSLRWPVLRWAGLLLLLWLLVACSESPVETGTLFPTSTRRVLTLPAERPTLPPSWTPTHTPTASLTATITPTASSTFTATPLGEETLCQQFFLIFLDSTTVYGPKDTIRFVVALGSDDASIHFFAINRQNNQSITFTMPGGGLYAIALPASRFPDAGAYHWTVTLRDMDGVDFCKREGDFRISHATPTASVTPSATHTPRRLYPSSPIPSVTPLATITQSE